METHDVVLLGTIISIGYGLVQLGDRLWKREKPEATPQSLQCGFQHNIFQQTLVEQTNSLKDMCQSLRTIATDAQLRHQIVVDKIERVHEAVDRNFKYYKAENP